MGKLKDNSPEFIGIAGKGVMPENVNRTVFSANWSNP